MIETEESFVNQMIKKKVATADSDMNPESFLSNFRGSCHYRSFYFVFLSIFKNKQ